MGVLRAIEAIRVPALDAVMSYVTYGGSELIFMLVALIAFWCVSKKTGYYILMVGFFGTAVNQICKLLFQVPRPWVLDPNFTIVEAARAGASGYSFPSGHTQTAVGTFTCLFLSTKNRLLRAVCVALIVLVPFSRMYLGVHTPLDVGVAFLFALVLALALRPVVDAAYCAPNKMRTILGVMLLVSLGFLAFVSYYPFSAQTSAENLAEGVKNAYTLAGAIAGLLVCYVLDQRYIQFETAAPIWMQTLKVLLGLSLLLLIKQGLKAPLSDLFGGHPVADTVRYFLVVLVAAAAWPAIFTWFSHWLDERKQAKA